jgi:hypothetical protein
MSAIAQLHGHPATNLGVYIQPIVQGTSCHCEFNLYYAPENPIESGRTRRLAAEAASRFEEMEAFFSRPYGELAEVAYRRSDDTSAIQRKIKHIFDPNFILNPGKLCF